MALITIVDASFEGGACQWSYDYDNTTMKPIAVRCVNNTPVGTEAIFTPVTAAGVKGTPTPPIVVNANTTREEAIPGVIADRFSLGVQVTAGRTRVTGVLRQYRMLGV